MSRFLRRLATYTLVRGAYRALEDAKPAPARPPTRPPRRRRGPGSLLLPPSRGLQALRILSRLFALTLLLVATSCGEGPVAPPPPGGTPPPGGNPPPGGTPPPSGPGFSLTRATDLVAGHGATVYGTGFADSLKTLAVDGQAVTITSRTDSSATFTVPALRACETDGRAADLTANGTATRRVAARVKVTDALSLRVAESRVLAKEDLACLQLAADGGYYVLTAQRDSVGNVKDGTNPPPKPLLTLATPGATGASAVRLPATLGSPSFARLHAEGAPSANRTLAATGGSSGWECYEHSAGYPRPAPCPPGVGDLPGGFSSAPTLFDPRYATAAVGDTVYLPDLTHFGAVCALPKAQVPTVAVRIAAVFGRTLIGVDLRRSDAADFFTPAALERLGQAARITDAELLPALQAVFSPAYQPNPAAGGRHLHVVSNRASTQSFAGFANNHGHNSQRECAWVSEMPTTDIAASVARGSARFMAIVMIHEYAHTAEFIAAYRRLTPNTRLPVYIDDTQAAETWATLAMEFAMRHGSRQETGAQPGRIGNDAPYDSPRYGRWNGETTRTILQQNGGYTHGTLLFTMLREEAGEHRFGSGAPTLWERSFPRTTLDGVAETLGTTVPALLDRWTLLSATDGLVDAAAAAREGLPHQTTWDVRSLVATALSPQQPYVIDRATGGRWTLSAPPGHYYALYFPAHASLGLSLQASDWAPYTARVRVTRVQ